MVFLALDVARRELVGAIVLGHGDDKGLILPPKIAPYQIVIVPIYKSEEDRVLVTEYASKIVKELGGEFRVHFDDRDNHTPGFKFNYWEQKGVPIRINIGPRDVSNDVVEIARRDTREKIRNVSHAGLKNELSGLMDQVQKSIFDW